MALPLIDDADRHRINPHIQLIPSRLGVGLDNFLEFPDRLEQYMIPSFLQHLVQTSNHLRAVGLERVERQEYGPQRELFPGIQTPSLKRQLIGGYFIDSEGDEHKFNLETIPATETLPEAFSGIRMHNDAWLLALYDNIMSYKPQ